MHGAILPLFHVPLWHVYWLILCVNLQKKKNEVISLKNLSRGVNFNYLSVNNLPVIWSLCRICKIYDTAVVSWSDVGLAWTGLG